MARNEKEVEIAKKAFELGILFCQTQIGLVESGTMPENFDDALEYALQYAVDNNIDTECLSCARYISNSCKGVPDRKRKEITSGNRCGGFIPR